MVICMEGGADLHMAQLMPLPLNVSCFGKIQIGFTFLVLGSPGQRVVKWVCVGYTMLYYNLFHACVSKQEAQLSPRDRTMRRVN